MTTIAYKHSERTIAVDSRATGNGVVSTDNKEKIIHRDDLVFVVTGLTCDIELFIQYYQGRHNTDLIPEADGLVIDGGVLYKAHVNSDGVLCKFEVEWDVADGSGGQFALAAMDHGKSARDAVEYAKTRCIYTGGEVKTICLDDFISS